MKKKNRKLLKTSTSHKAGNLREQHSGADCTEKRKKIKNNNLKPV